MQPPRPPGPALVLRGGSGAARSAITAGIEGGSAGGWRSFGAEEMHRYGLQEVPRWIVVRVGGIFYFCPPSLPSPPTCSNCPPPPLEGKFLSRAVPGWERTQRFPTHGWAPSPMATTLHTLALHTPLPDPLGGSPCAASPPPRAVSRKELGMQEGRFIPWAMLGVPLRGAQGRILLTPCVPVAASH